MGTLAILAVLGLGYLLLKNGSISLPPSISNALNLSTANAQNAIAQSGQFARSGLTIGQSTSAGLSEVGAALGGAAAATGPAAPFVAAAGVLAGLFGSIFKGANPLQVPAAQLEQIYEALVDNITALYERAHMISKNAALVGINTALQTVIQAEQQAGLGIAAQKAIVNVKQVITANYNQVSNDPDMPASAPIDLQEAHSYYVGGGTSAPGWYTQSVTKAAELTDTFLTELGV